MIWVNAHTKFPPIHLSTIPWNWENVCSDSTSKHINIKWKKPPCFVSQSWNETHQNSAQKWWHQWGWWCNASQHLPLVFHFSPSNCLFRRYFPIALALCSAMISSLFISFFPSKWWESRKPPMHRPSTSFLHTSIMPYSSIHLIPAHVHNALLIKKLKVSQPNLLQIN